MQIVTANYERAIPFPRLTGETPDRQRFAIVDTNGEYRATVINPEGISVGEWIETDLDLIEANLRRFRIEIAFDDSYKRFIRQGYRNP